MIDIYCRNCGTQINVRYCPNCGTENVICAQPVGITVTNIKKVYKNVTTIQGVSFDIFRGQKVGILGDNGSGKSTLMSIIALTKNPSEGQIYYEGRIPEKSDRMKIGYVPQVPVLTDSLSVKDNLKLWQGVYGIKSFEQTMQEIPSFLGITDMLKKKAGALSGGMKKKLAIAICFLNKPKYVILDEPFAALDSDTQGYFTEFLFGLHGVTLLLSSHGAQDIDNLCNEALVMDKGRLTGVYSAGNGGTGIAQWYETFRTNATHLR